MEVSIGSPFLWTAFLAFVIAMLALDLGVFHRKAHKISLREAAVWSAVWIALALIFNGWIWMHFGARPGLEFLTGYLIEKALSVDNLFVFLVIFSFFGVRDELQHRVLFWGILGALTTRAIFILAGAALMQRFHWIIYVFGAVLVYTGIKLLRERNKEYEPEKNPMVRLFRRVMPVTSEYHGSHFTVVQNGRRLATPLLLALVAVEATDIVFAVDSIPAIFAITRDPFIVFTSNIFALLGLRSLYFLLAGIMDRFAYLKIGLAMVLVFVGGKMLISELYKIPIVISLGVVALLIGGSIVISLLLSKPEQREAERRPAVHVDQP